MYSVIRTEEFEKWFSEQTPKEKGQINSRIARIREHGYFGVAKNLSKDLAELKWKNGRRVYFTIAYDENWGLIILLLGGNKNSQSKDINIAKSILKRLNKDD
ncbi:type II toxin-antitoxin system RelE/ParE family toxin [Halobacteriovorax sp. RZ-2]|uniref:type II toxin-antitoxin system RelE/ParE family toxin n=1 Tax=unclassified Halobacteriovorax TaxID=2639665 RepID=UPI0037223318